MSTERVELKSALPPNLIEKGWKLWMRDSASPFIAENEDLDMDTGGFPTKDEAIAKAVELMTDEEERAATASDGRADEPAPQLEPGYHELPLERIRIDGGTQPRATLDMVAVADYKEAMLRGESFPHVAVFFDGTELWLADGFHRLQARKEAAVLAAPDDQKFRAILADVILGSKRDALLYALGANATHGLPRSNEDKRRAVVMMFEDQEWSKFSDSVIAEKCHVSQPFVSKLRHQLESQNVLSEQSTRVGRDGVVRDTSNIGKSADEDERQPPLVELATFLYEVQSAGETEWKTINEDNLRRMLSGSFRDVDNVILELGKDRTVARTPEGRYRRRGSTDEPIRVITPDEETVQAVTHPASPPTVDPPKAVDLEHTEWEDTFSKSAKQVRELIKLNGGRASLMQFEEVDISSAAIHNALAEGAIEQLERGIFTLPPDRKPNAQPETPKPETSDTKREPATVAVSRPKPTVEELLKGRKLSVSFTWVPGLVGQVSVSVNMGNKPTDASRLVIDSKEMPRFPEDIVVAIHHQLKQTRTDEYEAKKKPKVVKRATASKASTAKKPTKKKAAKKAPKRGGKK